ncbi:P-loop containing nucleoside triphosphate hydrolase protein [Durotheca rogersii]|uniref:P-loop containing nucleoside triphosphate hydrolase protein n=1 Tax=Durotheca rogersii TaxID=419775 RepID=UPI00221F5ABA|nr:P-loop containing nucleoside triphosphate hydrolase protein [Durotheca rogersii]KAI5868061.1 P-loop containing nucleoside triphosphate hydrolase protein [Durotheca rogersii]
MSEKPIFLVTHPRACSTAFERVFMTRDDILECVHEPFGDSFYYGPERLSERYADDPAARESSGFANTTYRDVLERLEKDGSKGKRVFIKDMAYYLMPPDGKPATIAPSLSGGGAAASTNGTNGDTARGGAEDGNPTVLPLAVLERFHWTFLIRHPRRGIPSYFRCCVPPLDAVTGFMRFLPSEAGYAELRRVFDYLRARGLASSAPGGAGGGDVTVVDADDLLDRPAPAVAAFCARVGLPFRPDMLAWGDPAGQDRVAAAFAKWRGFHNDAIQSTGLAARPHAQAALTDEEEDEQWRQKFGDEAQKVIRACVDENLPHYEYLKSFAMKF